MSINDLEQNIINVKVSNIRPKYQNLFEWCNDYNNVYIARKGIVFINNKRYPESDSIWSNPFKIGKDGDRNEVIQKYEIYIRNKLNNDPNLIIELKKLKNKKLGCWCYPELCHGNVLLQLINEYN